MKRISPLAQLLKREGITQAQLAEAVGVTQSLVSRISIGQVGGSRETLTAILHYLTERLSRPVTFEELFSVPAGAMVEPVVETGTGGVVR